MLHLINYDLFEPGQPYGELTAAIAKYDSKPICYSCYAIKSDLSNAEICSELSGYLNKSDFRPANSKPDKIFVCTFSREDFSQLNLSKDVLEWLNK